MKRTISLSIVGILSVLCATIDCTTHDDPAAPKSISRTFVTFVFIADDVAGEHEMRATFSQFSTNPENGCWLIGYNLDDASLSGSLWGTYSETKGTHVGWHQWFMKDDGSFAPATCYPTFDANFTIGAHTYTLEGECSAAPNPVKNDGNPVATGTWSRDDGKSGTFTYYDGPYTP